MSLSPSSARKISIDSGGKSVTKHTVAVGQRVTVRHTSLRQKNVDVVMILQQVQNLEAIFFIARVSDTTKTTIVAFEGTIISGIQVNLCFVGTICH
jgi:hypothetical protein